jgi:anthranilate phosphoribosyltransferase
VTDVWEVRDGVVTRWEIDPAIHGVTVTDVSLLRGGEPSENAARIERLLAGKVDGDPAGRAAVLLNAGAAIYVAGLVDTFGEGIARAAAALSSGAGMAALERLRRASASTSG